MLSTIVNPSKEQIKNLPFTEKEVHHKSRKRLGYHVYSSYLFYAFHSATAEEKEQLLLRFKVWSEEEEKEEEAPTSSSDSSVRVPSCHDVSRFAGLVWRSYSTDLKEEWGNRASMLNSRPRNDGRFIEVPDGVLACSIEKCVKESLTQEWLNFVQLVRNAVVLKRNAIPDANRVVTMGIERVELGLQVFCKICISPLLRITIFGSPLFCKLQSCELIYRSKKVAAIHIHSHQSCHSPQRAEVKITLFFVLFNFSRIFPLVGNVEVNKTKLVYLGWPAQRYKLQFFFEMKIGFVV